MRSIGLEKSHRLFDFLNLTKREERQESDSDRIVLTHP